MVQKKLKYKGKVYGKRSVINRIKRAYLSIENPKHDFYDEAKSFVKKISLQYNVGFYKVAGVLAALSPLKSWDSNKSLLLDYLNGVPVGHTSRQVGKANRIMECWNPHMIRKELGGRKTASFFWNIVGGNTVVTIDRHATNAALGEKVYNGLGDNAYSFLEDAYLIASKELGIGVVELQSAVWYDERL